MLGKFRNKGGRSLGHKSLGDPGRALCSKNYGNHHADCHGATVLTQPQTSQKNSTRQHISEDSRLSMIRTRCIGIATRITSRSEIDIENGTGVKTNNDAETGDGGAGPGASSNHTRTTIIAVFVRRRLPRVLVKRPLSFNSDATAAGSAGAGAGGARARARARAAALVNADFDHSPRNRFGLKLKRTQYATQAQRGWGTAERRPLIVISAKTPLSPAKAAKGIEIAVLYGGYKSDPTRTPSNLYIDRRPINSKSIARKKNDLVYRHIESSTLTMRRQSFCFAPVGGWAVYFALAPHIESVEPTKSSSPPIVVRRRSGKG
ncbi:hypothetical protein EVAR_97453_1 [Eumeta japonica]|uniref:Uncharacterized protein n=1 Tax=Eumeta variegata TaxID=151549 RepID=A0A4C1WZ95_EUMVA|nr:hypothetical protein EVAR_97453_1 [Eumeta japonica]